MEKSQSSVLQKKGRLVKGTEETKQYMAKLRALKAIKQQKTNQHMAELRALKAIKKQKKISAIPANPPLEKPKKRTLKPM